MRISESVFRNFSKKKLKTLFRRTEQIVKNSYMGTLNSFHLLKRAEGHKTSSQAVWAVGIVTLHVAKPNKNKKNIEFTLFYIN